MQLIGVLKALIFFGEEDYDVDRSTLWMVPRSPLHIPHSYYQYRYGRQELHERISSRLSIDVIPELRFVMLCIVVLNRNCKHLHQLMIGVAKHPMIN